jgi:putative RecB family exonuclease
MESLSELREGLHVSVSQIKCFLRCPRQYAYRYVWGAEPEFMPANLVLGSAVHEGLAAFYRSVAETCDSPGFDVCMAAFHATLVGFRKSKLPIKDGDKIESQGEALLKVFYETTYQDPPNVVEVEVPFAIDLVDPSTGEVLEEKLVGALDLVVREDAKHVVGEHKTAARKWSKDQIEHEIQLAGYKMVGRKLGLGEVGLRLQVLTKTKKPKMIVENTDRTERDEREFIEIVVGVLRAIDARVFFPIRNSMCGGCTFGRRCGST